MDNTTYKVFLQKTVFFIFSCLLGIGSLYANETDNGGIIKGIVRTSDNKPAPAVSVQLKGTRKNTLTDDQGVFTLRNVNPGTYTVEVSLIGYETVTQTVTVEKGQTITVDLQLNLSEKKLSEVVITGNHNRLTRSRSEYVAKLPLKNIENPQVYSVISGNLIKEQVVTSYDDALKNAPGLGKLWSSTGRGGDGAGYYSLRGFAVQPTLVNGLPGLTNGGLDVANVERIEVVRGPSGTLFGGTVISYGGLINTITKRPYEHFGGEISYTGGSYGLNRFTADINTPLDKDGKVLLRVNGAYHDEQSFQDAGFRKTRFIAPALTYKATDRLTFLLNAEFLDAEGTNPTMLFFDRSTELHRKSLEELGYDKKRSYTSNNLTIKTPTTTLQAQMRYKLSDRWTSQTVVSRSTAKSQGYYSYLYESSQYVPGYPDIPSVFSRYVNDQNATTTTTDIQQNFLGDFMIGSMRNRVVVGLDYFNSNTINNSTGYVGNGAVIIGLDDTGILSREHMDSLLQGATVTNSNVTQEVYSAYISDVFNFTPQLSAMASLRVDHFKNGGLTAGEADKYSQTALSPKFGLVYQFIPNTMSVFANYMNGFVNQAPRLQNDGSTKTFDPEHANQWEGGVKVNAIGGLLTATLSYYDIKVSDIVMQEASRVGFYTQGGNRYSRGIDAELVATPIAGLHIVAGYAYNDSKLTETTDKDYLDRRPEEAGPGHQANLWASYRFTGGPVKGFGIGFGGNYSGENMILNRVTTGVFTLPSYVVLNGSLFYNADKFSINLKLDNITNKEYYKGWSTIEPQMPRRFSASAAFRF
ncbi:TonB-dependent receptor [Chitinophaga japonensis]|uniref:Iron complex outermembrane receptor protein n=1 Tax=Chitinophaga japonensis TaxID=104662 RepID=A0A562TBS7_CHIJA|nr:TonB-dependent receptor [Chitinophaga japonensis]TWI90979.1 iron complex outermembrane receptor protein [Chitinophaga japonensis]